MPVYLVAFKLKEATWMPYAMTFIKGPVDHVELAFASEGRVTYALSLTSYSKSQRFGVRDFARMEEKFDMLWYELKKLDERRCEAYCVQAHGKGAFSDTNMIMCGMPIESPLIARMLHYVLGGETLPADVADPETCASSCIKAMKAGCDGVGDVVPLRCTGNDAVMLAIRKLGAIVVARPDKRKFVEQGEFVLSDDWWR